MIESTKIKASNFDQALVDLEDHFIDEIESMLLSRLIEQKSIHLNGVENETIEFAGKTNYKILLRRPNKNVWSIPFKEFRDSIRKVLRVGTDSLTVHEDQKSAVGKDIKFETSLLLNVLPEKEYEVRSFVGNKVMHPHWGEGKIIYISETGNVEVQFKDRVVRLKPNFIKLK